MTVCALSCDRMHDHHKMVFKAACQWCLYSVERAVWAIWKGIVTVEGIEKAAGVTASETMHKSKGANVPTGSRAARASDDSVGLGLTDMGPVVVLSAESSHDASAFHACPILVMVRGKRSRDAVCPLRCHDENERRLTL